MVLGGVQDGSDQVPRGVRPRRIGQPVSGLGGDDYLAGATGLDAANGEAGADYGSAEIRLSCPGGELG
jgi:hypothetical protein